MKTMSRIRKEGKEKKLEGKLEREKKLDVSRFGMTENGRVFVAE